MPRTKSCTECRALSPKLCASCDAKRRARNVKSSMKWAKAHPEVARKNSKAWRENNPERFKKIHRNSVLKHRYGITLEAYEHMLAEQNGVCAICKRPNHAGFRLAVDHCHETGDVRGLLCGDCNRGIGSLGDSSDRLRAAAMYLEKYKK